MANRIRRRRRAILRRTRRARSLLGVVAVLWLAGRWRQSSPSPDTPADLDEGLDPRFGKRYYADARALVSDFRWMLAHRDLMRQAMRAIDPAFRTRLMLAVTAVNGCRYCSFYHAKAGLQEGLSQEEIDELLAGVDPDDHDSIPTEQAVALFYAQHWAETRGDPETAARERLMDTYGGETAEQIEMLLHAITMGNLMGNSFDYLLYRFGFAGQGQ